MPQSLSKVYVHITFSTKNRYPLNGLRPVGASGCGVGIHSAGRCPALLIKGFQPLSLAKKDLADLQELKI